MKSVNVLIEPQKIRGVYEVIKGQSALKRLSFDERKTVINAIEKAKSLGMNFSLSNRYSPDLTSLELVKELSVLLDNMCGEYQNVFEQLKEKEAQYKADTFELKMCLEEVNKQMDHAEKELIASDVQKDLLLGEIDHRVKNNFQLITSLLELQMMKISDDKVKKALLDSKSRIKSISLVHDQLYSSDKESEVSLRDYLQNLIMNINRSFNSDELRVSINLDIDDLKIPMMKITSLGLIANELLVNAYKHAFKGRKEGTITIVVKVKNNQCSFIISDDGVGLPAGFDMKDEALGCSLIKGLAKQLRADLKYSPLEKGTKICLNFPL